MTVVWAKVGAILVSIAFILAVGFSLGRLTNSDKVLQLRLDSTAKALKSTQDALVEENKQSLAQQEVIDEYHRKPADPLPGVVGGLLSNAIGAICPDVPEVKTASGRSDAADEGSGEAGDIAAARARVRESTERLRAATNDYIAACADDDRQATFLISLSDALKLAR